MSEVEVEWGFYALSASKAIFRARTELSTFEGGPNQTNVKPAGGFYTGFTQSSTDVIKDLSRAQMQPLPPSVIDQNKVKKWHTHLR